MLLRIHNTALLIVVSAINKLFQVGNIPKSVSFTLCYFYSEFSYIPCFKQQNALINAQQNITHKTLYVRYRLLHVSATWCHSQEVKNNKNS
jgi:hypothetical protein